MEVKHDFVVVGGGPAGSAISILLAMAGARVALVEKGDYGAFRIGEHLPPAVRGALSALGCETAAIAECAIDTPGIASRWKKSGPVFRPYFNHRGPVGLNVVRNAFDAMLFERAAAVGVATHAGTSKLAISALKPGWRVAFGERGDRRELRSRMLIDASGRQSIVARHLGSRWTRCGSTKAIAMVLPSAPGGPDEDQSLALESVPDGWLSFSPRPEGNVLTFYTVPNARRASHDGAHALVHEALRASSLVRRRLLSSDIGSMIHAGTWPAFPRLLKTPYGDGWFAVGEAAAAYDPISGHGVVFALETAFRGSEMALSDSTLGALGPKYQDAIAWRYEDHLRRREEIYREAADQFRESPFWSQFAFA
jgi:flavin-dependent dehydrogenase